MQWIPVCICLRVLLTWQAPRAANRMHSRVLKGYLEAATYRETGSGEKWAEVE